MQFSSTIVEVAIGLACIYVGLSLLASWINEAIATALNLRGKGLSVGIAQMVSDARIHASLFAHPIISSSSTGRDRLPSYLSASQFTTALLDVIGVGNGVSVTAPQAFGDIRDAVDRLSPGRLQTALASILSKSAGDYHAAVAGIEAWFDQTMDRVSGAYRRIATFSIFFIAIFIAGLLDADTIKFAKAIEWNSATRASLVATAGAAAKESTADALQHISSGVFNSLAFGWYRSAAATPSAGPAESPWQIPLGLIATVLAMSLGAPFWFDTLKFLMNVRNSGANPDESKT